MANAVAEGEDYLEDFGEGGFGGFPEMTSLLKPVICAVNGLAVGAGFALVENPSYFFILEDRSLESLQELYYDY